MIKRKIDRYLRDFYANSGKALLITGARQVGKTFSIRDFCKSCFDRVVEINFIETPEAVNIFKNAQSAEVLLMRLSAMTSEPLIKGKTIFFFDEVQACPEAVTMIKFLVDEGSYRYILSGSLLGVELNDLRSEPVGYMDVKEMFPLDFEEFVFAAGLSGETISHIRSSWENETPVDEFIHGKMLEMLRLYLIVGGMPSVVSKYLSTNDLGQVKAEQEAILRLYVRDITKYDPSEKLKIKDVFELIPSELNAKNKRFILKNLNENAKFNMYSDGLLWLKNAGVAIPVFNVDEPKMPLKLAQSRNLFKLFQSDVGLLACQYAESNQIRIKILSGDDNVNFGAIYENVVAQELVAHRMKPYYFNSKKHGEVDFMVEYRGEVLPIEVKSGKNYERHRALANIMDVQNYSLKSAIVLCNENLHKEGNVLYTPIYMAGFIAPPYEKSMIYKPDIEGL